MSSVTLEADIREIMFRWAGVESVDPAGRGQYVDGQELAYLEKLTGQPFLQQGFFYEPFIDAGRGLTTAFDLAYDAFLARLLLQSAGADLFTNEITYDLASDEFTDPGAIVSAALASIETIATNAVDAMPIWQNVVRLVIGARGGEANLTSADITALDTAITNSDATLHLQNVIDAVYTVLLDGSTFQGTGGDNTLIGGAYDDDMEADAGNDTLIGNGGDDILDGGTGDDTYVYNLGDGNDWIIDYGLGGMDVLDLGTGIGTGDITVTRISNEDLLVSVTKTGYEASIVVDGQFKEGSTAGGLEEIRFDDTSVLDLSTTDFTLQVQATAEVLYGVQHNGSDNDTIYGNGGNDTIRGFTGADILYGGDGDDTIYGQITALTSSTETDTNWLYGDAGNDYLQGAQAIDHLTGGTGNDTLIGYTGNDHYYFDINFGTDTLIESGKTDLDDTIHFGAGITIDDLDFIRSGPVDLRITVNGGLNGTILIDDQLSTNSSHGSIEYVVLSDSTIIDLSSLDYGLIGTAAGETLNGTSPGTGSGNDIIFGEDGNDTINGYFGSDELHGGTGNDTIRAGGVSSSYYTKTTANWLYGDEGDDYLQASYGDDHLTGGKDDDQLIGLEGEDRYYFFRGDGDDILTEFGVSETDWLHLGATIALSDISYEREGSYDLRILINNGFGGSILVEDQFSTSSSVGALEHIILNDTTQIDLFNLGYTLRGTSAANTLYGTLTHSSGEDTIFGGEGNDTIYGSGTQYSSEYAETAKGYLYGEAGNDTIWGSHGEDLIAGGTGNDTLRGRLDGDKYEFALGDGDDTIYEEGASDTDKIRFASGITSASLNYLRVGDYDLKILVNGGADGSITVKNQFHYYESEGAIEKLVLNGESDIQLFDLSYTKIGTASGETMYGTYRSSTGIDTLYGGGGNDTLYGSAYSDSYYYAETASGYLYGEDGNDTLYGSYGQDHLHGGEGNDISWGRKGDDLYYFNLGDGDDTIREEDVTELNDAIVFGASITLADLTLEVSSDHLFVRVNGGADGSIRLYYQFYDSSSYGTVEKLIFADQSVVNLFEIGYTQYGTASGNSLYGVERASNGEDTIYGGDGADAIYGSASASSSDYSETASNFLYGENGNDYLYGSYGDDLLVGGNGSDNLTGRLGSDTFTFLSGETGIDTIMDFSLAQNDKLDLAGLLSLFDPLTDLITDFVEITTVGSDSHVKVDGDGGANNFVQIATLKNVTGLTDEEALVTSGHLLAA